MRALWLHHAEELEAVLRGDEFLWGRDILVAPVTEKAATTRELYLPRGTWYDFWTNEKIAGGRVINRKVDLATMPLYVRSGAVIPFGPVKQYTDEKVEEPITLVVYPGSDGEFTLYEDDGRTFDFRRGEWQGTRLTWNDKLRQLSLAPAKGSKTSGQRIFEIRLAAESKTRRISFAGRTTSIRL